MSGTANADSTIPLLENGVNARLAAANSLFSVHNILYINELYCTTLLWQNASASFCRACREGWKCSRLAVDMLYLLLAVGINVHGGHMLVFWQRCAGTSEFSMSPEAHRSGAAIAVCLTPLGSSLAQVRSAGLPRPLETVILVSRVSVRRSPVSSSI